MSLLTSTKWCNINRTIATFMLSKTSRPNWWNLYKLSSSYVKVVNDYIMYIQKCLMIIMDATGGYWLLWILQVAGDYHGCGPNQAATNSGWWLMRSGSSKQWLMRSGSSKQWLLADEIRLQQTVGDGWWDQAPANSGWWLMRSGPSKVAQEITGPELFTLIDTCTTITSLNC